MRVVKYYCDKCKKEVEHQSKIIHFHATFFYPTTKKEIQGQFCKTCANELKDMIYSYS